MESTSAMLATTKYITEPLVATGRYFSRARVIFSSVISASFSRVLITPEVTWEEKTNEKLGHIKSKKNLQGWSRKWMRDFWETTAGSNQTGFQAWNIRISTPNCPPTRLRLPIPLFLTPPPPPKLTLSLPGYVTATVFDTPTFESVNEIIWCYHSNDTSWVELLDRNIHFSVF